MASAKRVLILEDQRDWAEMVAQTLARDGYESAIAATVEEARAHLSAGPFHLLILDIRLRHEDSANVEGMELLAALHAQGQHETTPIVMLSAFGTREQMRRAFRDFAAADFLLKEDFNADELLADVRRIVAERINFDLQIHWQPEDARAAILPNLQLGERRLRRDEQLQARVSEELDDLLRRLFHDDEEVIVSPLAPGHGGSGVLLVRPFAPQGAAQEVVVKFGHYPLIAREYQNYKQYVEKYIGGGRSTSVRGMRRTALLGGLTYSFLGASRDRIEPFDRFYERATVAEITAFLDRLFANTCGNWYAVLGRPQPLNLTEDYQQSLGFNFDNLEATVAERLKSVQGKRDLRFAELKESRTFINPILAAREQRLIRPTYRVVTHGDFNENNIWADDAGHAWLIDFAFTGPGHILRDVVRLDAVIRYQLLRADHATLAERLTLEERLCALTRFSQVEEVTKDFSTNNPALAKTLSVSAHLMKIARNLMAQSPTDDLSEYQIGLLYNALNTLRFYSLPNLQRQHALLSACLIAESLGL